MFQYYASSSPSSRCGGAGAGASSSIALSSAARATWLLLESRTAARALATASSTSAAAAFGAFCATFSFRPGGGPGFAGRRPGRRPRLRPARPRRRGGGCAGAAAAGAALTPGGPSSRAIPLPGAAERHAAACLLPGRGGSDDAGRKLSLDRCASRDFFAAFTAARPLRAAVLGARLRRLRRRLLREAQLELAGVPRPRRSTSLPLVLADRGRRTRAVDLDHLEAGTRARGRHRRRPLARAPRPCRPSPASAALYDA